MVLGDSLEMGGLVARPRRKETLKCPGALPGGLRRSTLSSAEQVIVAGHCCALTSSPQQREVSPAVSGTGPRSLGREPDRARDCPLRLGPQASVVSQRAQACLGARTHSGDGVWLLAALPPRVAGEGAVGPGAGTKSAGTHFCCLSASLSSVGPALLHPHLWDGSRGAPAAPGFGSICSTTSVKIKEPLAPVAPP